MSFEAFGTGFRQWSNIHYTVVLPYICYLNPLGQVYNQHLSQVWWHKLKVCSIGYVTAYFKDNRLPIYKAWVISSVPATQQPLN